MSWLDPGADAARDLPVRGRRLGGRWLPPYAVIAAIVVLAGIIVLVLFPGLAPYDPDAVSTQDALQPPSAAHLLGTDQLGRDVLSRVIAGARTAFLAPLVLAAGITVVSVVLGLAAGLLGGWVDAVIGRSVDVLYSIPALLVAIIVVGVTGGGLVTALVVLGVFGLPSNVRILRAGVMERAHLPYVEAARSLGVPPARILVTQMLPALAPVIVTLFFLQFTYGVVEVSSMSFLGLGVQPGSPDWGRMMFENQAVISSNVWATAAPGICIVALAVAANVVGDWLHARHEKEGRER